MGASPTRLHALRERLAKEFDEILQSKDYERDKDGAILVVDGQPIVKRHSPAMYNTIRQFLKDNGIDREPLDVALGDKPAVIDALPFKEEEVPTYLLPGGDSD